MDTKKFWVLIAISLIAGSTFLFSQTREIAYYNWEEKCDFKSRTHRIIVNNQAEFREMFDCVLLDFNFDDYTIIGVRGRSQGHFVPYVDIRILENEKEEKISIEVILSGGTPCNLHCRVMRPNYSRVIYTSKLRNGYEIEFRKIILDE